MPSPACIADSADYWRAANRPKKAVVAVARELLGFIRAVARATPALA